MCAALVGSSASACATQHTPKKVFVSYTHDPLLPQATDQEIQRKKQRDEQRTYVYALAQYLRLKGIDCMVDQYMEDDPPSNWGQWMEKQIDDSDYVLMVCSPAYKHYVTNRNDERERMHQQEGRGSQFEGRLIYGCICDKPSTAAKFIPIFFGKQRPNDVPLVVKQASCYEIFFPPDMTCEGQGDLRRLYARLTQQAYGLKAPPIGKIESFASVTSSVGPARAETSGATSEDFLKNITADDLGLKNVIVAFEKVTVLKSGKKIATFSCQHRETIVVSTPFNDTLEKSISEKETTKELHEVEAFSRQSWVKQIRSVSVSGKASVDGDSCNARVPMTSHRASLPSLYLLYHKYSDASMERSCWRDRGRPCTTLVALKFEAQCDGRDCEKQESVLASSRPSQGLELADPSGSVGLSYRLPANVDRATLKLAMKGHVRKASLAAVVIRVSVEFVSQQEEEIIL